MEDKKLTNAGVLFFADMFSRINVVEKAGTGIIRIRKSMKSEGLPPPVFEDMNNFFKIILYRPKIGNTRTTQEIFQDASDEILTIIRSNPSITQQEMALQLNLSLEGIKYHIKKLKLSKKIKHVGATKKGYWEILDCKK